MVLSPWKVFASRGRRADCSSFALGAIVVAAAFAPVTALAFAGIPDSGACTDFINNPEDYARHRQADITYRISNNFKARYPDDFSQYLVHDVAELWEVYVGGVTPWNQDIADRFSYYRRDPSETVYELKSVLSHEFGHAIGMQHSDACYYNNNPSTSMPYNLNFRTSGGVFTAQPTVGPEMLNEVPTSSSPGAKANPPIDGYFRTPGRDVLEFTGAAYPFQSVNFVATNAGSQLILFDSTDVGSAGGQTTIQQTTDISPSDPQQGRFFDKINVWIGNNIGIKSRYESWFIENFTGFDITQITLRVDGTSTVRAISESAPPFFTTFGASRQSSPEQVIFGWTAPPSGAWPPTASGWLSIRPDVHDWTISEALFWHFSNQAFPMVLAYFEPQTPWAFATPNTPPPQLAPQYSADPSLPPEQTPFPDDIELIPPATDVDPGTVRGFKAVLPMPDGVQIESFELLVVDWAEAELLLRLSTIQRNERLMRMFEEKTSDVRDLALRRFAMSADGGSPADAGFREESSDGAASGLRRRVLSRRIDVDLPESRTYAVRLVASNEFSRVTSLSMPEYTVYLGTQTARCDIASNAAYCCPTEMKSRVDLGRNATPRRATPWSSAPLKEPSCVAGGDGADVVNLHGTTPHFLSLGDGDDKVRVFQAGSVALLGRGDDRFESTPSAAAHVRGGRGNDEVHASELADNVNAGEGDDEVYTLGGDDVVFLGAGHDYAETGNGNDRIYPGSGNDYVDAGDGNDEVVYLHVCEITSGAMVSGGRGVDRLVLPTTRAEAQRLGLYFDDFEQVVEKATRASLFADCEQ